MGPQWENIGPQPFLFKRFPRSVLSRPQADILPVWPSRLVNKGDFPLAEWNEISGKCFSHTLLGPGDGLRSCDA